jgi:hypothetical protein
MAAEIVKITEEYIVDTEEEAKALIEKAKADTSFELIKYSSDKKEKKSKGEVIDSWYSLKLTKKF